MQNDAAMTTAFPTLFSTQKLGRHVLKNRICMSAHADSLGEQGVPAERALRYYEARARGGAGFLMCFGSASVHPGSSARVWNGVELFDDRVIPYLSTFADAMHEHGVPCVAQITHKGRRGHSEGNDFRPLMGPSPVREPNHRETPHELDGKTIAEIVRAFADAAFRLKQGGFDGCELMASACHLVDQFWTPRVNHRTDEYGGDLRSRMRFAVEVLQSIRERVGPDFLIGIRMTGDEMLEGGIDREAAQEIARKLDELRVLDYFNIVGASCETYATEALTVPDMSFPVALFTDLAASIKSVVAVPVIATGRINHPAVAERVLKDGQADLCVMTRALIADPDLPRKAQEGLLDDIRICHGYNSGCIDRIYTGRGVTCVQNAVVGREREWSELPKAVRPLKVVVVGGGPSGLECAQIARRRGHSVVLFEKNRELGGQTLIAKRAPARQDFDGACRYTSRQCEKLGVDFRLGVDADAGTVLRESPDVVVIATGARALRPDIPGIDAHGISAWDVLAGRIPPGSRVLVIDEEYGFQGPSVAEFLLDRGKRVAMVTSERTIGSFLGATSAPPVFGRLFTKGITLHCNLGVVRLEEGRALVRNVWSGREEELSPFDSFVYAYGGEAITDLEAALAGRVPRLELVGDCYAPRTLQHAILEGHKVARAL
jgi:2,4-dienoyl-CoA reductase-like NADH-dependent reductase (Old Yellow Enzyme family)/thioredoxin reductase